MELTGNTFMGGLNKDFNPIATPNDVLTDALNATLITFNGNELMLLNDMGNTNLTYYPRTYEAITSENTNDIDYKETVSKIREKVKLKEGYIPIGVKEHGDIIYIVSYNPEEKRTEIGSFPGPEYRPFDKVPSKEINKLIDINENTLNKIYNLTEEGDTLLKPYDLISDYSMEGLSPMFISTPDNKGLYIPKYINVNTNQDITNTINITYTYKEFHKWSNNDELKLYNYKLSKNLYDLLQDRLEESYTYSYIIYHPELGEDKYSTIEELYDILTIEYTYQDKLYVLLLTFQNLTKEFDIQSEVLGLTDYELEYLKNDNIHNPFISYPNIKKGDIGVSYKIEDINGIMYKNEDESLEGFKYTTYMPEVSLDENIIYKNVVISTVDYEYTNYHAGGIFNGITAGGGYSSLITLINGTTLKFNKSFSTEGSYFYLKKEALKYANCYNYHILSYESDDIIYIDELDYNNIEAIKSSDEKYEIIEKVISLNINNTTIIAPALLYRKIN